MRSFTVAALGGALSVLAISASAAPAHKPAARRSSAAAAHIYYDISQDPSSLKLLALSDSGKQGPDTLIDVIDIMRSPRLMLGNKWRIDCQHERMTIIETTRVEPGSPVQQAPVTTEVISTRATPSSAVTARLACTGGGQLEKSRVYDGELGDIARRFWAN